MHGLVIVHLSPEVTCANGSRLVLHLVNTGIKGDWPFVRALLALMNLCAGVSFVDV